jgi:hypothetical protein
VNSRYQSKQKSARREAAAIFHLLNCPMIVCSYSRYHESHA